MHAKTLFILMYEKHNMIFLAFETLDHMHKNIFFLFQFFCIFGSFDENRVF